MVETNTSSAQGYVERAPYSGEISHKQWTVAIYMVADGRGGSSDLDQVAIRELTAIVQAAENKLNRLPPKGGRFLTD